MIVGHAVGWNGNTPDTGLVRQGNRFIDLYQKNATNMSNQLVSTLATGTDANNMFFSATYITDT